MPSCEHDTRVLAVQVSRMENGRRRTDRLLWSGDLYVCGSCHRAILKNQEESRVLVIISDRVTVG